jgi:hypothetical protein
MKRADFNPFRGGKILGKKQYLLADIVAHAGEKLIDLLQGEETDPIILKGQADVTAGEFHTERSKNRAASAKTALEEALLFVALLHKWRFHRDGLTRACRQLDISKRTAENLMALLRFAEINREAFDHLARLGRTKLYHIARIPEADLTRLKVKKLQKMTERELLEYLRKIAPVRQRKRVSGLRRRLVEAVEIAENERLILGYGKLELDRLVKKTQELFAKLKKARDKAA